MFSRDCDVWLVVTDGRVTDGRVTDGRVTDVFGRAEPPGGLPSHIQDDTHHRRVAGRHSDPDAGAAGYGAWVLVGIGGHALVGKL